MSSAGERASSRRTSLPHTAAGALLASTLVAVSCDGGGNTLNSTSPTGPTVGTYLVSGLVRDTALQPIRDARVEVVGGPLVGSVAITDASGRFAFDTPIPTTAATTLQVTRDGFSPATVHGRPNVFAFIMLVATQLADVLGQFTLTLQAAGDCSQLPPGLRTRIYPAFISMPARYPTNFTAELSGSMFQTGYGTFFGALGPDSARLFVSSWDAYNWWLEEQPIIEQLDPDGHLSILGTATVRVSAGAALSAPLDGTWSYCAASAPGGGQNWPLTCRVAQVECRSTEHRLTLTRR